MNITESIANLNEYISAAKIDPNDFYCITIYHEHIDLQGSYTPPKAQKYGCQRINEQGFVQGNIDNLYRITLT